MTQPFPANVKTVALLLTMWLRPRRTMRTLLERDTRLYDLALGGVIFLFGLILFVTYPPDDLHPVHIKLGIEAPNLTSTAVLYGNITLFAVIVYSVYNFLASKLFRGSATFFTVMTATLWATFPVVCYSSFRLINQIAPTPEAPFITIIQYGVEAWCIYILTGFLKEALSFPWWKAGLVVCIGLLMLVATLSTLFSFI